MKERETGEEWRGKKRERTRGEEKKKLWAGEQT
jgi:hypothetical protein